MSTFIQTTGKNQARRPRRRANRGKGKKNQLVTKRVLDRAFATQIEMKKQDTFGQFPLSSVAQPSVITNIIPSAPGVPGRDGEVATIKKIMYRATLEIAPTTALGNLPNMRFLVFKWKPISVPTTADILERTAANEIINSDYKYTNRQLYTILADRRVILGANSLQSHILKWSKRLNQKIRYDDAAAPATAQGMIYYIAVSDQVAPADEPVFNNFFRVEYGDA